MDPKKGVLCSVAWQWLRKVISSFAVRGTTRGPRVAVPRTLHLYCCTLLHVLSTYLLDLSPSSQDAAHATQTCLPGFEKILRRQRTTRQRNNQIFALPAFGGVLLPSRERVSKWGGGIPPHPPATSCSQKHSLLLSMIVFKHTEPVAQQDRPEGGGVIIEGKIHILSNTAGDGGGQCCLFS
jgi:hypothetical protein